MQSWTTNQPLQNGRFIIQKYLGGGGFGETYKVIEQRTGKIFAIKTLNSNRQNEPNFQQLQVKFVNEALRLGQCSHPHIVKVHEVIQEAELWGMVMEYVDGVNLWEYVDDRGQLPEDEALSYIHQIGQALEYVHEKGFLHRDVKPENIILRQSTQKAVLIDFGLTREFTIGKIGSMTSHRSEGYAPIEQYERRGNFAPCIDVYALAATLYYLLTDVIPLRADSRKYVQLPPPKQINPRISDRVNEAILLGMELESQDRVQTVREWLELVLPRKVNPPTPQAPIPNPQPKIHNQPSQNIATPVVSSKQSSQGIFKWLEGIIPKNSKSDDEIKLIDDEIKLRTAKMDYTQLRDLLAAGKWKEADKETEQVMLAVAGREKEDCLDWKDIDHFSRLDLRTIDQLWVKYSNGHFGFSVQKRIYQSLGGTRKFDQKIWEAFSDRVGWRKGAEWSYHRNCTFDLKAAQGHLPWGVMWTLLFHGVGGIYCITSFLSRRDL